MAKKPAVQRERIPVWVRFRRGCVAAALAVGGSYLLLYVGEAHIDPGMFSIVVVVVGAPIFIGYFFKPGKQIQTPELAAWEEAQELERLEAAETSRHREAALLDAAATLVTVAGWLTLISILGWQAIEWLRSAVWRPVALEQVLGPPPQLRWLGVNELLRMTWSIHAGAAAVIAAHAMQLLASCFATSARQDAEAASYSLMALKDRRTARTSRTADDGAS